MKVSELKRQLESFDDNSEVFISYPTEDDDRIATEATSIHYGFDKVCVISGE